MKKILDRPTTKLYVDYDKKIVLGQMSGDIQIDDYKAMLLGGAILARKGQVNNIIIDRREVVKQDAECRIWVKNYYLKKHVKPIVPSIKKVAIVEAQSIVGKIYGKTIFASLGLLYPNLTIKSFSDVQSAIDWVTEQAPKPKEVEEIINDEKNFFSDIISLEKEIAKDEESKELVPAGGHSEQSEEVKQTNLINRLFSYFFPG